MDIQLSKITLKDLDVELFRKYIDVSMSAKKAEVLNFNVNSTKFYGVANNEADSIYKRWSVNMMDIAPATENQTLTFPDLKCSIYKGNDLNKKILPMFGQLVNVNIFYIDNDVQKLEFYKTDENDRVSLKITILCASNETSYVEYTPELLTQIFQPDIVNEHYKFTLSESE